MVGCDIVNFICYKFKCFLQLCFLFFFFPHVNGQSTKSI